MSLSAAGELQMLLFVQSYPVAGPSCWHMQGNPDCAALLLCICMFWALQMLANNKTQGPSLFEREIQSAYLQPWSREA